MIHVDNYEEDHNLRRGSSLITVVDPYHPAVQQRNQQQQQPQQIQQQQPQQLQQDQQQLQQSNVSSRKSSLGDTYSRNTSLEQYQSFEDQFSPYTQRPRTSESQAVPPSRRVSLRQSPGSPEPRVSVLEMPKEHNEICELLEEKPIAYVPEESIREPKTHITAQQRWLWAYNKIIMQLDVSICFIH